MRIWAVVRFIGSVLFKTKTGASGLFLLLLKPLWNILSVWQAVEFLPSHMMPLWDFLNSFWGPFALMVLGFLLIGKVVYDRWPETPEPDSQKLTKAPTSQPASENKQPEANNKWLQETQGKLTPLANRRLLKRALTEAYKEGLRLSQMKISEEEAAPWALRTGRLIKAALEDQNRAQQFIEAEYKSITDLNQTKGQIWVEGCLNELYALLQEVDSLKPLKLRPDFDGRAWVSKK